MVTSVAAPIENPVKGRKSFLLKYKRDALNAMHDHMPLGYSLCNATEKVNIPHFYYQNWRRTVAKVDQLASKQTVVPFKINGESCKIHPGCPSELVPIEGDLKCGSRGFKLTPIPRGRKLQGCQTVSRQRVPKQKYSA